CRPRILARSETRVEVILLLTRSELLPEPVEAALVDHLVEVHAVGKEGLGELAHAVALDRTVDIRELAREDHAADAVCLFSQEGLLAAKAVDGHQQASRQRVAAVSQKITRPRTRCQPRARAAAAPVADRGAAAARSLRLRRAPLGEP